MNSINMVLQWERQALVTTHVDGTWPGAEQTVLKLSLQLKDTGSESPSVSSRVWTWVYALSVMARALFLLTEGENWVERIEFHLVKFNALEMTGRNEAVRAERNHILELLSISRPCELTTNESQPTSNGMQFRHRRTTRRLTKATS